ncbi:hypothetical protein TBLA_0G01760 [Henningerozyma blattae CBS 6284]|uniref:t-SNARE coiled-coil homology domain-containing protein n=1 Tax=Henningerozyma blattae (strain ATCC 34711 / CBS 6284 / DSM 70876 / NBRC 10599 / NRRL Y-10934 / UCD 77-7) TaxID=1071380 RepID=I2H6W7_HENB6|nr:hypothetical protein TBLA_0G01760 [Tetrapisispora blattae CBS 6284]CCH62119.1 hypothetical protein TBLA_0G01760 [Tetrapisispora blattae CBS 6284]
MSTLLSSYEQEFKTTLNQTVDNISIADTQSLPQRNSTLKQIEIQKDELIDLLDQIDIEINNSIINSNEKANWKSKLRNYKTELNEKITAKFNDLMDLNDRDRLFGGASFNMDNDGELPDNWNSLSDEQKQQLIKNHSILQKTGERLRDSTRIANETENIGSQIMNDLRSQRETLENARSTLFQADSYVDKSIKTLKTMSRRLVANKFISYAIIAVLILLILLVLFAKFK